MEPNNMQPGTEPVQTPNQGQDDVRIIGEMPRRPAKRGLYTLIGRAGDAHRSRDICARSGVQNP